MSYRVMFKWQFSIADPNSQAPLPDTLWAMSLRGPLLNTHSDWYLWLFLSSLSILMGKRNPAGTRSLFCCSRHRSCHLASMLPFWLLPIPAIQILACRKPGLAIFLYSSRAFCTCPLPPSCSPCPMYQFLQTITT